VAVMASAAAMAGFSSLTTAPAAASLVSSHVDNSDLFASVVSSVSIRAVDQSSAILSHGARTIGQAHEPHDVYPTCTYDGVSDTSDTPIVFNVTPGASIAIVCSGWEPNESIIGGEFSPLYLDDLDESDFDPTTQSYTADPSGNLSATFSVPNPFSAPNPAAQCPPTSTQINDGYYRCGLVLADVGGNGSAIALDYAGQEEPPPEPAPPTVVGMAATADGNGYWIAWSDGYVSTHGDAHDYGDASGLNLNAPIAHIVATPSGHGFWLVAADGGTFAFGNAGFFGSMGGRALNAPVVDMAPSADGNGYWLVASDGGIFAFGDAKFHGSMGGRPLNKPIVGLDGDVITGGYWLVATDGGIFAFGAPFFGSTGAKHLNQPVNGMTASIDDGGYLFVASDGGIFAFGDAKFHGSAGSLTLVAPVVGMALNPSNGGYWLVAADGGIFSYDTPFFGSDSAVGD
jgi:ribosomal protein L24E